MKIAANLLAFLFVFIFNLSIAQVSVSGNSKQNSNTNLNYSYSSSSTNSLFDQSDTEFDFSTRIELDGHSQKEEVSIEIPEGSTEMQIGVQCFSENGSVLIELVDNEGVKQGKFKVGTDPKPGKKENAMGSMKKSIKDPGAGEWKVLISPKKAKGSIKIVSKFNQ